MRPALTEEAGAVHVESGNLFDHEEYQLLGGKARAYSLPQLTDARGTLVPISLTQLSFQPVRIFWVSALAGVKRGGHGHRFGRQLLCSVSGVVTVELRWRSEIAMVTLGPFWSALMIEAPVWAEQTYNTADARLLVLCDTPFDPEDYLLEASSG